MTSFIKLLAFIFLWLPLNPVTSTQVRNLYPPLTISVSPLSPPRWALIMAYTDVNLSTNANNANNSRKVFKAEKLSKKEPFPGQIEKSGSPSDPSLASDKKEKKPPNQLQSRQYIELPLFVIKKNEELEWIKDLPPQLSKRIHLTFKKNPSLYKGPAFYAYYKKDIFSLADGNEINGNTSQAPPLQTSVSHLTLKQQKEQPPYNPHKQTAGKTGVKASLPHLFQFLSAYSTHQNILPLDEVETYIENLDMVTSSERDGKTGIKDEILSPFSMLITGNRESFSPGLFLLSSSASSIETDTRPHNGNNKEIPGEGIQKLPLFPKSMVSAFESILHANLGRGSSETEGINSIDPMLRAEKNQPSGLIWGEVTLSPSLELEKKEKGGTEGETKGISVFLRSYENPKTFANQAIYFNEMHLPDVSKNTLKENGWFVFPQVPDGLYSVQAQKGDREVAFANVFVQSQYVSAIKLRADKKEEATVVPVHITDSETQTPQQVIFQLPHHPPQSHDTQLKLPPVQSWTPLYIQGNRRHYSPVIFSYHHNKKLDIPLIHKERLRALLSESSSDPSLKEPFYTKENQGAIVGWVHVPNSNGSSISLSFEAHLMTVNKAQHPKVIYFDSPKGSHTKSRKGFLIPRVPAGLHSVVVSLNFSKEKGKGGRQLHTQMLLIEPGYISMALFGPEKSFKENF